MHFKTNGLVQFLNVLLCCSLPSTISRTRYQTQLEGPQGQRDTVSNNVQCNLAQKKICRETFDFSPVTKIFKINGIKLVLKTKHDCEIKSTITTVKYHPIYFHTGNMDHASLNDSIEFLENVS